MARNGSGTMTIPNSFVSGNTITAAGHNQNFTDIASEITNSVAADGQTSMTGPLKAANGTAAAPSVAFASDTNTGVYRHGADELGFSVGGVLAGWFDSAKKLWAIGAVDVAGALNVVGSFTLNSVAAFPVPTAQIANDAVTYAKIQNVTTARLLGRATAGSGDTEEISLGSDISFSGTTLNPKVGPTSLVGYLSGLELSTAGSSATFGIAVGAANDVSQGDMMTLASAYTKTTSSWAVGSGNGALDTGAIATSTWYHVFLIKRTDTGVVDVLFSTSPSAPTMPTNYTLKRRIGSMKTDGSSQWRSFTQTGDEFIWAASVADVNAVATTASRANKTLASVPTGVVVKALLRLGLNAGGAIGLIVTSLQENDQAPSANALADIAAGASGNFNGNIERWTDTSAQVGVRSTTTGSTYSLNTYGWTDTRGK